MIEKITVPDIGDFENVEIIDVLVAPGDKVTVEQSLITLESDKATMDVPSPVAGTVTEVLVKSGDKVSQGNPVACIDTAAQMPEQSAVATPPPPAADTDQEVRVPNIGDFKDVAIIEILVTEGDYVNVEQPLLTLESDKATMDVPSPIAGAIRKLFVHTGDKISEGDRIAVVAQSAAAPAAAPPPETNLPAGIPAEPVTDKSAQKPAPLPPVIEKEYTKPHAGPATRRFARELGVDLSHVEGSGRKGRIIREDVKAHIKNLMQKPPDNAAPVLPAPPDVDFRKFGEVEIHPLSRINKLSAAALHRNWLLAPHVTQCIEADITDMEEFRQSLAQEAKRNGYKMTPLAFLIKAAVASLKKFPRFNASLQPDEENLVLKKYFHIGVAVDTPNGLVVPVLRDADRKGLTDIARELADISANARDGKLKREDMQGGCFTISSLGGIGGSFFTPLINLPEVAILGVSRAEIKPHWDGENFVPRRKLPLSLSYDHRVIDGAAGARFITYYAELLGDIRRLTL